MPRSKFYKLVVPLSFVIGALLVLVAAVVLTKVAPAPDPVAHKSAPKQHVQRPVQPKPKETFPKMGEPIFPTYRLVALYGSPGAPRLGVLGERSAADAINLAKQYAADYQAYSAEKIMPAMEIITTVASASPTENGDYSNEVDAGIIQPWIDAAREAGVYVVLDLQPGRTDFLSQAKMYEGLLKQTNVGLALDPEWRLAPNQVHMKKIGSVDVAEVNATSAWLADVVKQNQLPQKVFLLHQFRNSMITNRAALDVSHAELGYVIQMDGNGAQSTKQSTWNTIRQGAPANVQFGWKNFIDEDKPMLTPEQTMQVVPKPWYVSYQ